MAWCRGVGSGVFMVDSLRSLFLWVPVVLLGVALRVVDLGVAPMHADEAVGARITAERLEGRGYAFDPGHFHGPTLSWIGAGVAGMFGRTGYGGLDAAGLRLVPAVLGSLVVMLPLVLRPWIGGSGALMGGVFLATSPLLCIYSRVYIHEAVLVFFSAVALGCLAWWLRSRDVRAAVCGGIALGLMAATKETFVIPAAGWCAGLAAVWPVVRGREFVVAAGAAGLGFLVVVVAAYGNPLHFLSTFFIYATDAGHAKPWHYYAELMVVPKYLAPQWWTEAGIALLAAIGAWNGWRRTNPFAIVLAVSAVVQFGVYSAIFYKTPWLMMGVWMQVCLLAGEGAATILRRRGIGIALAGVVVFFQFQQTCAAVFRFPNDSRNPLVYSPTSSDIHRLRDRLHALKKKSPAFQRGRMAVLGNGYWPLPWYLRDTIPTGYFEAMPEDLETFAIVISMPEMSEESGQRLAATHEAFFQGLRHEVPLTVFVRKDIRAEEIVSP